jgi:hypothetical protein
MPATPATKAKSGRRAAAPALTAAKKEFIFGVTFDLNGTAVPVTAKDITNAKENGLTLALPGPVELGSFKNNFRPWFEKQFGVKIPDSAELPKVLAEVVNKLEEVVVTVYEAKIEVVGEKKEKEGKESLYTLVITAKWPEGQGVPLIPGVLEIEGVAFGVSKQEEPSTP